MLYAIVVVIILILDQCLKHWTLISLTLNTEIKELIPGILSLRHVHNTGAAFGLFSDKSWFPKVMVGVVILVCIGIIVMLATGYIRGRFGRWMVVLVMGGAIGNAIDRLFYGFVVDMLYFDFWEKLFKSPFATFNIADVFLVVGGILFCIYLLFQKEPVEEFEEKKPKTRRVYAETALDDYIQDDAEEELPRRRAASIDTKDTTPKRTDYPEPRRQSSSSPRRDEPKSRDTSARRQASRPVREQPPAPTQREKPAQKPPVTDFNMDVPEFTLEDILSEFSDK